MAEVDEDLIRNFIANQGGKISNAELVVHFRNYLKDPRFKGKIFLFTSMSDNTRLKTFK